MSNKHFCQGPTCHEQVTQDRFLKSRGVIRGRYAYSTINQEPNNWGWTPVRSDAYFCSQGCKMQWLNEHMTAIEMRIPVPFITHRRESQGYEKVTETVNHGWGDRTHTSIKRVDNRTEVE